MQLFLTFTAKLRHYESNWITRRFPSHQCPRDNLMERDAFEVVINEASCRAISCTKVLKLIRLGGFLSDWQIWWYAPDVGKLTLCNVEILMNHAKALESRLETNNEKLINYGYTTSDAKSACSAQHFGDYLKDWVEAFLYVINFRMCEKQPQLPLKISVLLCKFHFRFLLLSGFMGFEESKSQSLIVCHSCYKWLVMSLSVVVNQITCQNK